MRSSMPWFMVTEAPVLLGSSTVAATSHSVVTHSELSSGLPMVGSLTIVMPVVDCPVMHATSRGRTV